MEKADVQGLLELWKNKWVKLPIITILMALALFVLFLLGKAIAGYNVKILGFESNPSSETKSTVIHIRDTVLVDSSAVNKISSDDIKRSDVNSQRQVQPKVKEKIPLPSPEKKDTQVTAKNMNTGTNNGNMVIGDNGTINNVGQIQPHPTAKNVMEFETLVPDKNTNILLRFSGTSAMSQIFVNELIVLLKNAGYTNVNAGIDLGRNLTKRGMMKMESKKENTVEYFIRVEQ